MKNALNTLKAVAFITLLALGAWARSGAADTTTSKGKNPSGTSKDELPSPEQSQIGTQIATDVDDGAFDADDHVPCFFTLKQLMALQPVPGEPKLSEHDESVILENVAKTIDEASNKELTQNQKAEFMSYLKDQLDGKLVGKTAGEALVTIMQELYTIREKTKKIASSLLDPKLAHDEVLNTATNIGGAAFAKKVEEQLPLPANSTPTWFSPGNPVVTADNIARLIQDIPKSASTAASSSASETTAAEKTATTVQNAASSNVGGAVVNAAREVLNKFVKPDDIGCAFQILSWDDSRLIFGRSVANGYVAVQVTVRNINPKEEFIVHDAMMRVRTDINGALGQYFQGVDKVAVEAYNNAGESLTRRGIVGNSIAAASALLSTLQPIVNVDNFSNAVAAFNGGVVPGWKTMSPDHQKEQLLMIANNGFSATNALKTVVPKSSAATFYTWFPVKPFMGGWWVQNCAKEVAAAQNTDESTTNPNSQANPPQVGVNLKRAQEVCAGKAADWKTLPYRQWSSISDQLFRDLSLVIVAGIHVREDSKNAGSVSDLKCPKDSQGRLDLSKASTTGTLGCDVSGENLDKFTKLSLENAGNLVDPFRPEGTLSDFGKDNSTAKVAFSVSDLKSATGDSYNVFAIGKDGSEINTGQKVYLDQSVSITGVNPSQLDLSKKPLTVVLTGSNLGKLKTVCFKNGTTNKSVDMPSTLSAGQASVTIDVTSAGLTKGNWNVYADECPATSSSKDLVLEVVDGKVH